MQTPPLVPLPARSASPSQSDPHDLTVDSIFDESSIMALLRSSFVPDDEPRFFQYLDDKAEEIRCVKAVIRDIQQTRKKNSQLKNTLFKLKKTLEGLKRTYDTVHGLFAPVRRLPVEEILQESVDSYIDFSGGTTDVLGISQVCHRWRNITKSMPRLWAGTCWTIDLGTVQHPSLISHHLLLSQSVPLVLDIYIDRTSDYGRCVKVLRPLFSHAHRWYSLSFHSLYMPGYLCKMLHDELQTRPRPIDGYFPKLRKLSIVYNHKIWREQHEPNDAFEVAPNLSSLTLLGVHPECFRFPYSLQVVVGGRCAHLCPFHLQYLSWSFTITPLAIAPMLFAILPCHR